MENLKAELDRIEAELAELKRQYDFFFQGTRRTEPVEERRRLEASVRRFGNRRFPNTQDQFRFSSLQSRFYSFANLWARMVRELEEGRLHRDASGNLVARAAPAPVDDSHLDRVMEDLRAARVRCGMSVGENDLAAIRKTLADRARELSEQSGKRTVEYRVTVEDGKPKIKAALS